MIKAAILLCFTLVLSGCSSKSAQIPPHAYAEDEVYQGYPCTSNCPAFKIGYDTAESKNYTRDDQCQFPDSQENIGCKAYVQEYIFEHKTFDQLMTDL